MPTGKVKEVAARLKAVYALKDARAAREKAAQAVEKRKTQKLARPAEIVAVGAKETLSYYAMPPETVAPCQDEQSTREANARDPAMNTSDGRFP